jgi:hypothetical protein
MTIDRPKRLTPPAPYGELLKRFNDNARMVHNREGERSPDYLSLIRQLPCLYCGVEPCGEAAHVDFSSFEFGAKRKFGKRPHDSKCVPLCRDDHLNARHAQHKGNEEAFWLALGIQPYAVARDLHAKRGDLVAMRAVVMVAIANRSKT